MAIPVIYPTWSAAPLNVFIYLAEYSTVLLLVPTFGLMLLYFFKNDGVSKFHVLPLIAMVILSSLTIGLRWVEEINIFAEPDIETVVEPEEEFTRRMNEVLQS